MDDRQRKDKRKYYNQRCKRKSLAGLMDNTEDRNMWRNMSVHVYWHGTWWKWWRRDKAISFLMNQPIVFRKRRVQLLNQTFIIVLFCVLLGWQGLHFFFPQNMSQAVWLVISAMLHSTMHKILQHTWPFIQKVCVIFLFLKVAKQKILQNVWIMVKVEQGVSSV